MSEAVERSEMLLPGPAQALGALLGVPVPDLEHGEGLPLLWHWIYLLERPAQSNLGPDGHPVRGVIPAPPGTGRRRMWAGGRVRTNGWLRSGEIATRQTSVLSINEKQGRSGSLTFVVVQHRIRQGGHVVIDEQQDLVYREAVSSPEPELAPADSDESQVVPPTALSADEWAIDTSPILLFRFSALTYNAHRIHYDRDYARDVEGYPGLLTHGPLQALAMAEAARRAACADSQFFEYRLTKPLFAHQGMVVAALRERDQTATSVHDRYGRQTASGTLLRIG
jgi:3-methylfumaryl-CoA hydratase